MISIWLSWILTFQNKLVSFTTLIASVLLLSLVPVPVLALESLHFREAKNYKEKKAISFIKETSQTFDIEYILAIIDLNNDGLNEYIIKPKDCISNHMCRHHIIAFMEGEPISLLSVNARKIIINDKNNYGVRNLVIYNNLMNDFKKSKYQWNPYSYLYEQKH